MARGGLFCRSVPAVAAACAGPASSARQPRAGEAVRAAALQQAQSRHPPAAAAARAASPVVAAGARARCVRLNPGPFFCHRRRLLQELTDAELTAYVLLELSSPAVRYLRAFTVPCWRPVSGGRAQWAAPALHLLPCKQRPSFLAGCERLRAAAGAAATVGPAARWDLGGGARHAMERPHLPQQRTVSQLVNSVSCCCMHCSSVHGCRRA